MVEVAETVLTRRPDLATASAEPRGVPAVRPKLGSGVSVPRQRGAVDHDTTAEILVGVLRDTFDVIYTQLSDSVARLDTTGERWILYLDSGSPAGDHFWVLLDLARVLHLRLDITDLESAVEAPRLRVMVPD